MTGSHGLLVLLFLSPFEKLGAFPVIPTRKIVVMTLFYATQSLIEETMGAFEVIGLCFFSCVYCSPQLRGKHSVMGK